MIMRRRRGPGLLGVAAVGGVGYAVGKSRGANASRSESATAVGNLPGTPITIRIVCPDNAQSGSRLSITVEGRPYEVVVPAGIGPRMAFNVAIVPTAEAIPAPPVVSAAGIPNATPVATPVEASVEPQQSPEKEGARDPEPQAAAEVGSVTAKLQAAEIKDDPKLAASSSNPFKKEQKAPSRWNPFAKTAPKPEVAWLPATQKAETDKQFHSLDPDRSSDGICTLSPGQVHDALTKFDLPDETLSEIWELADIDKTGRINDEEFAVAMYLCSRAVKGEAPPKSLSGELLPPSTRD